MQLTDLPEALLSKLPNYLDTLHDRYALISSSKPLYKACANTQATFPPIFPGNPNNHRSSAYSHFIIAGSARQLADWAVSSDENRLKLGNTLAVGGIRELLKACINIARWSTKHVQALCKARVEIINPLSYLLEGSGLRGDVVLPFFVYLTYCELFHHSVDNAWGNLPTDVTPLPVE